MKVYRKVGEVEEVCPFGVKHEVGIFEVDDISDTGEVRAHNNGYETTHNALLSDAQGRIYHQHTSIDFSNNTSYRRDDDGACFWPRPLSKWARTIDGTPLNDRTPRAESILMSDSCAAMFTIDNQRFNTDVTIDSLTSTFFSIVEGERAKPERVSPSALDYAEAKGFAGRVSAIAAGLRAIYKAPVLIQSGFDYDFFGEPRRVVRVIETDIDTLAHIEGVMEMCSYVPELAHLTGILGDGVVVEAHEN